MTTISWVAVLRQWFGAERYARDYEYLDANYRKQAEAVARLSSPDAAGSGGEARAWLYTGGGYPSFASERRLSPGTVSRNNRTETPLFAALTPDATQTREAELAGFLEQILLYADPNGDGLYDGAGDIAGVKQNGALVLKGSFITICARIRAALNGRAGA